MDIAVCIKAVAGDIAGGIGMDQDQWVVNEWDAYALEEALRLGDAMKREVRVVSVGGGETEFPLRKALALGAHAACRVEADGSCPYMVAASIAMLFKQDVPDILVFGAQSSDRGGGQVGGMVAALLGVPFTALATSIAVEGEALIITREIENRRQERFRMRLPCAVSVQTGINSPRYASVRGIQRAGRMPLEQAPGPALSDSGITLLGRFAPERRARRMLDGTAAEMADTLASILAGGTV